MTSEPEAPAMHERSLGIIQGACEEASVEVSHIYQPDGAETMDCGHGSHDPGMVSLYVSHEDDSVEIQMGAGQALMLANRLTRAVNVIMESMEDVPDVEREAHRFGGEIPHPHPPARELTEVEQKVWDAWNALPDDHKSPVKQIARDLSMDTATVAAIVFPAETFGPWGEEDEPDLPQAS